MLLFSTAHAHHHLMFTLSLVQYQMPWCSVISLFMPLCHQNNLKDAIIT